jgi:hypothetical protein
MLQDPTAYLFEGNPAESVEHSQPLDYTKLNRSASKIGMPLKGLSHEIDFDNIDKNLRMLALINAAAGF